MGFIPLKLTRISEDFEEHFGVTPEMLIEDGTKDDEIHCTLYAPDRAKAGNDFLVQLFAHLASQAVGLRAIAEASDEDAKRQAVSTLDKPVERGNRLTFELRLPKEFNIDEPIQSREWNGIVLEVPFVVSVPNDYAPSSRIGKIIVSQNDVPIGRLTFKIEIVGAAEVKLPELKPISVAELAHYRCC